MDTLSRETTLSDGFVSLLKKGSAIKVKNLLILGSNSFLFEYTPIQKRFGVQKRKLKVTKVVSLVQNYGKST